MFFNSSTPSLSPTDAARLVRIEQKLDLILKTIGIDGAASKSDGLSDQIRAAADRGEKIEAIKLHRAKFGSSLRDAKDAVEAYMDRK